MKRRASLALLLALVALVGISASAVADDAYSERTLKIARELNCPVCAGETVADSQSELARQMRAIIETKVQAGESDEEIKAYFVERYGESILAEPPKSGFTLTLWWMPIVVVLLGSVVLALYLRERTRRSAPPPPEITDDQELEAIERQVFGGDRGPSATVTGGA